MKNLKDMQNERDTRCISIDRVGVRGVRFPIVVSDKANRTQNTVATVALMVDLPQEYKGTHMSRFVEALHDEGEGPRRLNIHTALRLPNRLLEKLSEYTATPSHSTSATFTINFLMLSSTTSSSSLLF